MNADDSELVYQPIPPDGSSEVFPSALSAVVAESENVAIASPYLSFKVVHPLVDGRSFRIVTDQDACFGGRIDLLLAGFFEEHNQYIRSLCGLHAKVVLGAHEGLLGSANLTNTGLCKRFEMACVMRGSRRDELAMWFDALWEHADPLDLDALCRARTRGAKETHDGRATMKGLTQTGKLGWLADRGSADLTTSNTGLSSPTGDVLDRDVEELATRLRELTEDRATARVVLDMLARALEHVGLPADDDRLHLNFGRPGRISVTLGQRHVAWCRRKGEVREFGMMLQSFELVSRAVGVIPGAWQRAYTKNKVPVVPELYVPVEALDSLDSAVLGDWERSIHREVECCGKSGYLSKKRVALYHMLKNRSLCSTAVRLAHPLAWWFGVNNGTRGHMTLKDVTPLFDGSSLRWSIGNSKTAPRNAYAEMLPGDRVLIWTGHGHDKRWGVIGTAMIAGVEHDHVVLDHGNRFEQPLMPYSRGQPIETKPLKFLLRVFGEDFKPLGDVRQAVFGVGRTNPITIAKISEAQVNQVVGYMNLGTDQIGGSRRQV